MDTVPTHARRQTRSIRDLTCIVSLEAKCEINSLFLVVRACVGTAEDSLMMVRLRESETGRKACRLDAPQIRSALVRLDVYRRECMLVQVAQVGWTPS